MTTLLSRTASCHNAPLLQYNPGNDLQVDPETDCLEGPAMVQRATILLVLRLTHCHRLCACVVDHNFLSWRSLPTQPTRHWPIQAPPSPTNCRQWGVSPPTPPPLPTPLLLRPRLWNHPPSFCLSADKLRAHLKSWPIKLGDFLGR